MTNKVVLEYDDDLFNIRVNETVVESSKDIDEITDKFKQIVKDSIAKSKIGSWENILSRLSRFNFDDLEINTEYKTLSYKNMKYFYASKNIFYLKDDTMMQLQGGYDLFDFVLKVVSEGFNNYEEILDFCNQMIENHINYRVSDSIITVSSPGFSYGYLEYNFYTKKIRKGIAIENSSFEEFVKYVNDNK